jgi:hypothetical protein
VNRLAATVVSLAALCGCTPGERAAWDAWHAKDPAAAEAFAHQLADRATDRAPTPGDCASYVPLFEAHGLPAATFKAIAWRESGCRHDVFVINRTDSGGGLLGINLKGSLAATWHRWCGATLANITDAEVNVRCAAAAYRRMGMAPWS